MLAILSHHGQQKSPKCSTWMQSQKQQNDLCSFPRQNVQYYGDPSLWWSSNAEEVEKFYEDLQDLLELTPKKDVLFIIGDWNAKVGSQQTPGVTGKFGLGIWNEAGQRLIEFFQENTLGIANTLFQQHKRRLHMDIIRWSTPKSDWLYSLQPKMEKLYTVSKTRLGADCGSDHELLIAKFRLKLE